MDLFKKYEEKFQKQFREIKLDCFKPCYVIKVTIICFDQISVSEIEDKIIDIPDPFFELECPLSRHKQAYVTTVKSNQTSGYVNETFQFTIDQDQLKKPFPLLIRLYDHDVITNNDFLGEVGLDVSGIPLEQNVEKIISFTTHGRARIRLIKCSRKSPDFRLGLDLCESEMKFREKRLPLVAEAIRKLLGEDKGPQTPEETPIISVAGSGGGYRALIAMNGAFEALNESGVTDTLTYVEAVSGSSWYLSSLYASRCVGLDHQDEIYDQMKKGVNKNFFANLFSLSTFKKFYDSMKDEKGLFKQPVSFVDIWGFRLGSDLLADQKNTTLSNMREYIDDGKVPFPIFPSVQVKDDVSTCEFSVKMENTPYEIGFPQLGISVLPEHLGSVWERGFVARKCPEFPLHYLQGYCGCAFSILARDLFEQDNEYSQLLNSCLESLKGSNTPDTKQNIISDIISGLPSLIQKYLRESDILRGRNDVIGRTGLIFNITNMLNDVTIFPLNPIPSTSPPTGEQQKTILKMFGEKKLTKLEVSEKVVSIIDSGIESNVFARSLLRPQRQTDLLIVFDFSFYSSDDYFLYDVLCKVAKESWTEGLKFPEVDFQELVNSSPEELLVYESTCDDCPTVMWFTLSNQKFKQLDNYKPRRPQPSTTEGKFNDFPVFGEGGKYETNKFEYEASDFDKLNDLMYFNVISHIKEIYEQIGKATERKKRRIEKIRKNLAKK